jgi:hypothetical protein
MPHPLGSWCSTCMHVWQITSSRRICQRTFPQLYTTDSTPRSTIRIPRHTPRSRHATLSYASYTKDQCAKFASNPFLYTPRTTSTEAVLKPSQTPRQLEHVLLVCFQHARWSHEHVMSSPSSKGHTQHLLHVTKCLAIY